MADYYINFNTPTEIQVDEKLIDTINDMGSDDRIIITVNNAQFDKMRAVTETLEKNRLDYYPKGGHISNEYIIIAQKGR